MNFIVKQWLLDNQKLHNKTTNPSHNTPKLDIITPTRMSLCGWNEMGWNVIKNRINSCFKCRSIILYKYQSANFFLSDENNCFMALVNFCVHFWFYVSWQNDCCKKTYVKCMLFLANTENVKVDILLIDGQASDLRNTNARVHGKEAATNKSRRVRRGQCYPGWCRLCHVVWWDGQGWLPPGVCFCHGQHLQRGGGCYLAQTAFHWSHCQGLNHPLIILVKLFHFKKIF